MNIPEDSPDVLLAEGGSMHEPELLRHGYTRRDLEKARKTFQILAWQDRFKGWHYPRCQFDEKFRVLSHVVEILRLFRSRDSLYVLSNLVSSVNSKKSLLNLIRSGQGSKAVEWVAAEVREQENFGDISPKQVALLREQTREMRDTTRYVVVTTFLRPAAGVYNVADNMYCHGHISEGCLIKSRKVAVAVAKELQGKRKGKFSDMHVLAVRKTGSGFRALENLPGENGKGPWRPKFKTPDYTPTFVPIVPPDTRAGAVDAMPFAARNRKWLQKKLSACADRIASQQLLVERCKLTPRQADAVLEMRLWSLTRKVVKDLEDEMREAVVPSTT